MTIITDEHEQAHAEGLRERARRYSGHYYTFLRPLRRKVRAYMRTCVCEMVPPPPPPPCVVAVIVVDYFLLKQSGYVDRIAGVTCNGLG